MIDLEDNY